MVLIAKKIAFTLVIWGLCAGVVDMAWTIVLDEKEFVLRALGVVSVTLGILIGSLMMTVQIWRSKDL